MPNLLADSIERFLAIYDFDPAATIFALDEAYSSILAVGYSEALLTLEQQTLSLKHASERTRSLLLSKTLIDTPSSTSSYSELAEQLQESSTEGSGFDHRSILRSCLNFAERQYGIVIPPEQREEALRKCDEDARRELSTRLSKLKLDSALTRWFASRLDVVVQAIEQFDETNFGTLLPEALTGTFRELHINALLGNYGTACILCGAMLERTLQDLLPSTSLLNDVIKEAKVDGLLSGHDNRFADRIQNDRNKAVHGKMTLGSVSPDYAWETVICTRKLISNLYRSRST